MDLLRLAVFYIRDLDAETLDFYIMLVYLIRVVKGATPPTIWRRPKSARCLLHNSPLLWKRQNCAPKEASALATSMVLIVDDRKGCRVKCPYITGTPNHLTSATTYHIVVSQTRGSTLHISKTHNAWAHRANPIFFSSRIWYVLHIRGETLNQQPALKPD